MPHRGRARAVPVCGSGMRGTHCKPFGFSSGGQLPVPPALDPLRGAAHALLLCLIEAIIALRRKKCKENSTGPGNGTAKISRMGVPAAER